jgi:hypothetical protein
MHSWTRNIFAVSLLTLFAALAAPRAAAQGQGEPPTIFDVIHCSCSGHPDGGASSMLPYHCTISPTGQAPGDLIHVGVEVYNILGQPLVGATITSRPIAISGAFALWCTGQEAQAVLTDEEGKAHFVFDRGSVFSHPDVLPDLDFDLTAEGGGLGGPIALDDCPEPLTVIGFDVDAGTPLDVTLADFAIAASDWRLGNSRSDFNHDGAPSYLTDFAMFGAHFHDVCP